MAEKSIKLFQRNMHLPVFIFSCLLYLPGVVVVPPVPLVVLGVAGVVVVVGGVVELVVDDVPVVVGGVGINPGPENSPGASDCRLCMPCCTCIIACMARGFVSIC